MLDFASLAQLTMERCDSLGAISQNASFIDRRYLTAEHMQANALVTEWMQQAGMTCWQDQAANCWGRYVSSNPDAKRLIIGSHLDTVPNGGRYDGMMGVLAPLALIHGYHESGIALPFHVDIVGFGDEEGTRFGSTLLGSRALTGNWPDQWEHLADSNGITVSDALATVGLDFHQVKKAALPKENLLAFLELHIEQGPVLEQQNLPVGVVTAIAGARRIEFTVTGMAGHAGTVPMHMRQDALCATSEMILMVEKLAKEGGVVATVGKVLNKPNGVNVISGQTVFTLDIRSENDEQRDNVLADIQQHVSEIANKRDVNISQRETHNADAVSCDLDLQQVLSTAISKTGYRPLHLASGAGHDAMEMAKLCPMAMLFMRCHKGISHHPDESVLEVDVKVALEVLNNTLVALSKS
ncbi:allantoate amidohydrolase [Glaciecola sp. 1036]|uniref:allantoate amidohydrolase n=1 Tax=Alteromonadaceae TaxID=72275 RepID=UPI003D069CE7